MFALCGVLSLALGSAQGANLVVTSTADSGADSLRQALADAGSGDTITFHGSLSGQTIVLTNGQITVTNSLFIDASALSDGIAIDGNASSRIFKFSTNTTNILTGLVLTNGLVIGISPDAYGGGIYNGGNLTLNNSTLSGNEAHLGGGIYNDGGSLFINNSTLYGNDAQMGGGISDSNGTVTINNSTLYENESEAYGGGIYIYTNSVLTLNSSILSNNHAGPYCSGGGIFVYFGQLIASNSTLIGNSADRNGGGISTTNGTLMLVDSHLSGNSAGDGGGIYSDRRLEVDGCTLSDNFALGYNGHLGTGGGILNMATLSITNSILSDNSAQIAGGICNDQGILSVNNCVLSGNSADYEGGGIYNHLGTLFVDNSFLSENSTGDYGGGIWNTGTLVVNSSAITGNSSDSQGGGILNRGTLAINFSTLSGNHSLWGGGVKNSGTLMVNSSTLSGNSSAYEGGGIFNDAGVLILNSSTLSANSSLRFGGGICDVDGTLMLTNTIVAANFAKNVTNIYGAITSAANSITNGIPLLAPLGDYGGPTQTMPPLSGSQAIDAGTNTVNLSAIDQRGYPRLIGGTVDVGACEFGFQKNLITNSYYDGSEVVLEWTAFPMWEAVVMYSTNLVTMPFTELTNGIAYPFNSFTDTVHDAENQCFYRVEIAP